MKLTGNTILITGGSGGIGYAFAERFLRRGNHVIICGRRADKLAEAKAKHPGSRSMVWNGQDVSRSA